MVYFEFYFKDSADVKKSGKYLGNVTTINFILQLVLFLVSTIVNISDIVIIILLIMQLTLLFIIHFCYSILLDTILTIIIVKKKYMIWIWLSANSYHIHIHLNSYS